MMKYAIPALALAMLAGPADAVPTSSDIGGRFRLVQPSEGPGFGLRLTGEGTQLWGQKVSQWSNVVVGPFAEYASQHPDGKGARGLPPILVRKYVCPETKGGVQLSPLCGKRAVKITEPPECVVNCGPTPNPIPLPATALLLFGALAGLGWLGRGARG